MPAVSVSKQGDPEARNVAIFVEPSPFSHISGMKNRFECLIRNLKDQGDDVIVFTPDRSPPKEYCGAKVCIHAVTYLLKINPVRDRGCIQMHTI